MYRRWTTRDKRQLRQAFAEGATTLEAAEELGRTAAAVKWMAWRLGIHRQKAGNPIDSEKRARVLALLSDGMNHEQIGRALGRTRAAVWEMVRHMERIGLVRRVGGPCTRHVRYVPCRDKEMRKSG